MAAIPSFIFGAGTRYKTQEELDRAREQVKALLGDIGHSGLTGWGSALADIGKGIGAGLEGRRINAGQEGLEAAQAPFSQTLAEIAGGYGGGGVGDIATAGGSDTAAGGVGTDTGAGAPSVDLSGDKAAFVSALMPAAIKEGARVGVDPRIIVAQAAQETGWGKHAPNNNYFGIKSHGKGGGQTFATDEVINGKRVRTSDSFRKFNSPADSVTGYADFLASNKRYGPMRSAQGLDAQLRALGASGYATDPNYASSVGAIARSLPLVGGGGASGQAGGGKDDSFLQARPTRRRMTPAMLEQEMGTEARPIWDNGFSLEGRRRMTPDMMGTPDAAPPAPVPAASPLDGRRRMTPAMMGAPRVEGDPFTPPLPMADPARFAPEMAGGVPPAAAPRWTPPTPTPAGQHALAGSVPPMTPPPPLTPAMFNPAPMGAPQPMRPPVGPDPIAPRLGNPPPSMAGTETAPYPVPGRSMAGTETAPPISAPAPIAKVDPFTDMILGDKASQFRPGNVSATPPAETARGLAAARTVTPFGANVFPAAPPAPGTPAAAGFGVPQQAMAGGGGANRQVGGGGGGQFPPAPSAPGQQGGGDKIAKLTTILASPYASDEQKRMATAMLQREYDLEDERRKTVAEQASPEYKLGLRKLEAEVAALENPGSGFRRPTEAEMQEYNLDPKKSWKLNTKTGEISQIGGAGVTVNTGEKIADWQGRDANFYDRAASASVDLDAIDTNLASGSAAFVNALPGSDKWGAYVQSPEYLQARNVGDAWIYAILRKESGATLPDAEMKNYRAMFLPQPGESVEQIENKRQLRKQTEEALALGLKGSAPELYQSIVDKVTGLRTIQDTIRRKQEGLPPADETPDKDGWITKPNGTRVRAK